mgnify:CR=1 FL=1
MRRSGGAVGEACGWARASQDPDALHGGRARAAEGRRLSDGFLAREPARVAFRRIHTRVAVRLFVDGEAAVAEPRVALE